MHKRYCSGSTKSVYAASCCNEKPIVNSSRGYPESMRLASKGCKSMTVTIPAQPCDYITPVFNIENPPNKLYVPMIPGGQLPVVDVVTNSASVTVKQTASIILSKESDPYNPDTRFAKYFPAPPLPYQCPARLPNNDPLPSTRGCIDIQRFQGSTKK